MNNQPLVSVLMITYNHEAFISEAIEGFLMQKTNFPIELIIADDASTDQNQSIILEYTQKSRVIKPIRSLPCQASKVTAFVLIFFEYS